ncbi:mitochondrial import inner membrane translocase subunit Tim9 [Contarinia nasturtii]|uniref:mitochondrial import inner membrane translocase subunit Tim9 n=1 Tax=Contarinia nasturtii TaxID=265458 RepID=UPI0012D4675E|nr:mitochondrial import inner membrane translocase subunit Tim9 [Contarinia nasturtii]
MAAGGVPLESLDKDQLKTFSDFLQSYNKLSEICFMDCVNDFTSRDIRKNEDLCALNCMEKYLKMNQRISQRFQEFQMIANENAMAMVQKPGKS